MAEDEEVGDDLAINPNMAGLREMIQNNAAMVNQLQQLQQGLANQGGNPPAVVPVPLYNNPRRIQEAVFNQEELARLGNAALNGQNGVDILPLDDEVDEDMA